MRSFRFSLRFVILFTLASLLLLTWILLSLISFKTAEQNLIMQKNQQARRFLGGFFDVMENGAGNVAAQTLADALVREKVLLDMVVIDGGGHRLFSAGDVAVDGKLRQVLAEGKELSAISSAGYLTRYLPWRAKGGIVGAGRIRISLSQEYELLHRSRQMFVTYFLLDFLVLLVLGSYILSRLIVYPMRRLIAATERISAGDLQHRVHVLGTQEMAELAEAYNTMVAALKAKEEAVTRHLQALEEANLELRQAREESVRSEKMASIGLLGAGMAHEIGTPLASIIGYAGLLREALNESERSDFIRRIEQDAEKINRLVHELLDYARPKAAVTEPLDLCALAQGASELLKGQGVLKKIDIIVSTAKEVPPVCVDRQQLEQVFINLFINARDAMPTGGKITVTVSLALPPALTRDQQGKTIGRRSGDATLSPGYADNKEWVKIEVTDTGSGIPAENLPKIFDPFFTTKEPGEGTGLGLSICSRIIDSFGGRIFVDSAAGIGTTFTIFFPTDRDSDKKCR